MTTPAKKRSLPSLHIPEAPNENTRSREAVGAEATGGVTLRKLWAWEKSLLGWLLSYSFWSSTGMPCHLALLSLSCSKPPGSCSTQHTCSLMSCASVHQRRNVDFGHAKWKASLLTLLQQQLHWCKRVGGAPAYNDLCVYVCVVS